jgi:hypothetical protein
MCALLDNTAHLFIEASVGSGNSGRIIAGITRVVKPKVTSVI